MRKLINLSFDEGLPIEVTKELENWLQEVEDEINKKLDEGVRQAIEEMMCYGTSAIRVSEKSGELRFDKQSDIHDDRPGPGKDSDSSESD